MFHISSFQRHFAVLVAATSITALTNPARADPGHERETTYQARASGTTANEPAAGHLTLKAAVDAALHDNPGLSEMQARAAAMAAVPPQVGTLPDPRLSFGAMNFPTDTFDMSQEPMTQIQVGLSQMVPFPGKLALIQRSAEYEAAAASHNVDESRLLLIRDVTVSWWRMFNLDRALSIVSRNKNLLRQFIQIAMSKYKVGKGLQQDVLLAQLELSRLMDLYLRLNGMRATERARLNALLAAPADNPVVLPDTTDTDLPRLAPQEKLFNLADQTRPMLAVQKSRIEAARTRVRLAEKDYYPDFNLGAMYGVRSGRNANGSERADFASFQVSINLPIFTGRKQSKAVDQRNSELLEGTFRLQDLRNRVHADISATLADYNRARQQFRLFETGILPQARQTVASMLAGYEVNKVDFLNLINAQVTLYNYEMNYWRTLSDAREAAARLAADVGGEQIYE